VKRNVVKTQQKTGKALSNMKEIEVKIRIKNPEEITKKLNSLGYEVKERIFQRTYRCWRPDRLFSRAGIFPRTRYEKSEGKEKHTFTVKSRFKDPERGLFEREEYEVEVEDAGKVAKMLALMGMSDQRILEKERIVFSKKGQQISSVLLDRLCFGTYLEIEGEKEAIDELVKKLKLENEERLGMAYWDVYWHYCKNKGINEKKDLILEDYQGQGHI